MKAKNQRGQAKSGVHQVNESRGSVKSKALLQEISQKIKIHKKKYLYSSPKFYLSYKVKLPSVGVLLPPPLMVS